MLNPGLKHCWLATSAIILGLVSAVQASEWSTWLGPHEDNTTRTQDGFESDLSQWNVAWTKQVGRGYSTITTSGKRLYTNGHDQTSQETIVCLDIQTGETLWTHSFEADLIPRAHGGGPNASIVIDNDRLYAISKDGQLLCLRPETGQLIWEHQLTDLLEVERPSWGFRASPIATEEQLIVSAGPVAGLNKFNGKLIWMNEVERRASYGTPVPFTLGDLSFIAAMDGNGFAILSSSGGELFHKRMVTKNNVISNTPLVFAEGTRIFIHTNAFSEILSFDGVAVETVWNDRKLQNSQSAAVIVNDVLYGLNGLPENNRTRLYARNLQTEDAYWSVADFGFGSLIAIDDTLLVLTEDGELVTAQADPDAYQEISRKTVLELTCWTKPTYAHGRILLRNDAGQIVCLVQN